MLAERVCIAILDTSRLVSAIVRQAGMQQCLDQNTVSKRSISSNSGTIHGTAGGNKRINIIEHKAIGIDSTCIKCS